MPPDQDSNMGVLHSLYEYSSKRCDAAQDRYRAIDGKAGNLVALLSVAMAIVGIVSFAGISVEGLPLWSRLTIIGGLLVACCFVWRMIRAILSIFETREIYQPALVSKIDSGLNKLTRGYP